MFVSVLGFGEIRQTLFIARKWKIWAFPQHGLSVNAIRIMIPAIDVAVSKVILDFVIAAKLTIVLTFTGAFYNGQRGCRGCFGHNS